MTVTEIKNIGSIGNYSIDGFIFTCDRCGISEQVPKKGINNTFISVPDDWVFVKQRMFNIENYYCRSCGKELSIGF